MYRIASIVLIALAVVACGGSDDEDGASASGGAPTATIASAATIATVTTPAGSTPASVPAAPTPAGATTTQSTATEPSNGNTDSADGAPTNASSDFPDVQAPLEAGSSGEVGSMDPDPFGDTSTRDENSRVKVTINEILDPVESEVPYLSPEAGNRWFGINITMEATGSGIANTGVWTLATTDGAQYTNIIVLGSVPDIAYGSIEPGASTTGVVVFEIPEDAVVQWILMSPTIFVGENLVFVN